MSPSRPGGGQVPGDVEDRLLGVVEGRADVEALPRLAPVGGLEAERGGHGVEVAAELEGGGGEHHGLLGEQPARASGRRRRAARRRAGCRRGCARARSIQSTSWSESAAIRSAMTKSSWAQPLAWVLRRRRRRCPCGKAETSARAASRTSTSASASSCGIPSIRPGAAVVDRVAQHLAGVGQVVGLVALDVPLGPTGGAIDRRRRRARRWRPGSRARPARGPRRPPRRRTPASSGRPRRRRSRAASGW